MIRTLILFLLLFPVTCFAQYTISGRILNQADTKPLANVSVFISNATIGDKTADDGTFALKNIKPGKYELVISSIGYDIEKKNITITNSNITLPDITIFAKTNMLSGVTIKVKRNDPDRQRNFEWFRDEFLGTSAIAKECKILNPELLDLNYDDRNGILTGSSVDFLIIENNALGYRIKYLLTDFTLNNLDNRDKTFSYSGSILFEPMKGTPGQQQQWQAGRQQVYEGSQMHFMRAALNNRVEQEGFRIFRLAANTERPADSVINEKIRIFTLLKNDDKKYKDSLTYWKKKAKLPAVLSKIIAYPLTKEDIIKPTSQRGIYSLDCSNDALYITYNKNKYFNQIGVNSLSDAANTSNTLAMFNTPVTYFDSNGAIINPKSLTYDGVWVRNRLAGLLPVDYEPLQSVNGNADSALVKTITDKLTLHYTTHPVEKVYLHFDKPYYTAKDTMYFKAYVTQGAKHQLNDTSSVLYADLITPGNAIQQSIKLHLTDGVAWGDFALPDSLKQGSYRVRAYTQLMKEEGDETFFDQSIPVGSTRDKIHESAATNQALPNSKPAIQFFPEGGNLVDGIRSKIAFKALGPDGSGIDVKGVVLDNDNKEISTFTSVHLGMGYFYLEPNDDKAYHANLSYANGQQDVINLPKIAAKGIKLDVTGLTRSYAIKITGNKTFYKENNDKVYTLVVVSGGTPHSYTCKLEKPEITLEVPKTDLRTGVAIATLFKWDGEPLSERLFFVQNNDQLKVTVNTNKNTYLPRDKVDITLNAATSDGNFAPGYFSVSVTDESKIQVDENAEPTIMNNLLLTSDLKGYIEQPNYYFINSNEKTAADLDLVMLTHGYRSFEWKKLLNNGYPKPALPAVDGLQISGHVTKSGKPVVYGKITLFTKDAGGLFLKTLTDTNGKFVFTNLVFADTARFVIKALTEKNETNVDIQLDKPVAQQTVAAKASIINGNIDLLGYVQGSKQYFDEKAKFGINKVNQLKSVTIKADKDSKLELKHSQNINGAGQADQVIGPKQLEKLSGFVSLYDALRSKVGFVKFFEGVVISNHTQAPINGEPIRNMLIVVDGIPMDDDYFLNSIQTSDVESVEVVLGSIYGAVYGARAQGGAIIVTMKVGRKADLYSGYAPGVTSYTASGYYKAREFYQPVYDNPATNKYIADLRSTIYWKPNVITDANGNATIEYFNADGKGTYRVVVEGIDADGNLGRQVYRYRVY
jgi:hypothetical protein